MRRILLVEPAYPTKYPPLGLMKISTYHKLKGDYVHFVKGCVATNSRGKWDRIYVSTLFTYHWKITLETIRYYSCMAGSPSDVFVGGVMATLLGDEIQAETGASVIRGLLDRPGQLDPGDKCVVDLLTPDYQLLRDTDYRYDLMDSYIGYATRGCPNRCEFCAVSRIEPEFIDYLPLRRQVQSIEEVYGPKEHLILLDNNVLASDRFESIIDDIAALGFERGARLNGRLRRVDFNQGMDLRFLTPEKMSALSRIPLRPMRLAFDHIDLKEEYVRSVQLAVANGVSHLSNYVLYNYTDTPQDFYERLRINVELNQEMRTQIYSFPMKYVPLDARDRSHVGPHWNRRLLRGVQCILLATKGKVGTKLGFFEAAFGRTAEEFIEISMMPEEYIIYRRRHQDDGALEWRRAFRSLRGAQLQGFAELVSASVVPDNSEFGELLRHYRRRFR